MMTIDLLFPQSSHYEYFRFQMGDGATEINKAGEEAPMSLLGLDL